MDVKAEYHINKSKVKGFVISINHVVKLKPLPYLGDHKTILEQFLLKRPHATLQNLCDYIIVECRVKKDKSYLCCFDT